MVYEPPHAGMSRFHFSVRALTADAAATSTLNKMRAYSTIANPPSTCACSDGSTAVKALELLIVYIVRFPVCGFGSPRQHIRQTDRVVTEYASKTLTVQYSLGRRATPGGLATAPQYQLTRTIVAQHGFANMALTR